MSLSRKVAQPKGTCSTCPKGRSARGAPKGQSLLPAKAPDAKKAGKNAALGAQATVPTCGEGPIACSRTIDFAACVRIPDGFVPKTCDGETLVAGFIVDTSAVQCIATPCQFTQEIQFPDPCDTNNTITCSAVITLNRVFFVGMIRVVINVPITSATQSACASGIAVCPAETPGACTVSNGINWGMISHELCIPVNNLICVTCDDAPCLQFQGGLVDVCETTGVTSSIDACGGTIVQVGGHIEFVSCSTAAP